jgi:hypothetical protein
MVIMAQRDEYIEFFADLIDRAFAGQKAVAHFCDDVVLELYLDGEELHWRRIDGRDSGPSRRDG